MNYTERTPPDDKITEYRQLNETEIALINAIKKKGMELERLIDEMEADRTLSQRWITIGKTNLQLGLMALTRAVAKPDTF